MENSNSESNSRFSEIAGLETPSRLGDDYEECLHCGQEIPDGFLAVANTDPWGGIHGHFCDEDCASNAGEAYDERRAEAFYGGSEPFTAKEIADAAQRQRENL